jgi:hypothetical protein
MSSNRLKVLLVSLLAVLAISAVASGSASATGQCYKVITAGTGQFEEPTCVGAAGTKEYIKIAKLETEITPSEYCAEVETAETGAFEDAACTKAKAKGKYIKVHVPTYWLCREGGTEKYENHLCAKKTETGKWSFLPVEKAEKYAFTDTSGVTIFESTLGVQRVIVICKKDKSKGNTGPGGRITSLFITYEECNLYTVTKYIKTLTTCVVPNIATGELNGFLIKGKGIGPEDEFEPAAAGGAFATIKVEGCALESKEEVKGKQICQLPEAPVGLVTHEVVCSPSGGALTFGGKPASYYGTELVELTNGWAWGAEP